MKKNLIKYLIKTICIIAIILLALILYGHFIGTKKLKINDYKIIDKSLPNDFYGLKIVHISDIHYGFSYNISDLQKLVNKINELNPDIIVFTGDLIDKQITEDEKNEIINLLSELKATIGKYAIKGNLDTSDFDTITEKSGFTNLNDTYEIIYSKNDKILISGLSTNLNSTIKVKDKLNEIYDYIDNNDIKFKILLMHEPDYIEQLKKDTFNLVLAGHSHNGQINLPLIGKIKTPKGAKKYYKNFYDTAYGKLYISSGIGTSKIPVRLFNDPTINLYRLVTK